MPAFDGYEVVEQYALEEKVKKDIEKFYYYNKECFKSYLNCSAGRTKFALDCEGNILPCLKYRNSMGNILNKDFESIWKSDEFLDIIHNELIEQEECIACKYKPYCRNICPGIYKMYTQKDDRCKLARIVGENCS